MATTYFTSTDGNEVVSTGVYNYTDTGATGTVAKIDGTNHAGFNFTGVTIPKGSGILSAKLFFPQLANYTGTGTLSTTKIYGHNNGNSWAFAADSNFAISFRNRTNAYVDGSTLGATATQFTTNGVDVTAIVEEIVNRVDFTSNSISLLFIGNGTAGNFIQPYMYDYTSGFYKAQLVVTLSNSTSSNFPGTATSLSGAGTAWASPNNVMATDSTLSSPDLSLGGAQSNVLQVSNFGFSIPTSSNINGIEVIIARNGYSTADMKAQLQKSGGPVGYDHSKGVSWSGTAETINYGGPNELWGAKWTPAEINNSGFGFLYQIYNTHGGSSAGVDSIRVIVYYDNVSKGYYDVKQSYQLGATTVAGSFGNQGVGWRQSAHLITNNSGGTINATRLTWRFGAVDAFVGGGKGDPGTEVNRTGTPLTIRMYTSLSAANTGTSPIQTWQGTLKNPYLEDYDFYFPSPYAWTNASTLVFVITATGTSGSGEPDYIMIGGNNYYPSADDDTTAGLYTNHGDGDSSGYQAQPINPFYEVYENQSVTPAASAFPTGGSVMTVAGYEVTYGSTAPVGGSVATAAGAAMFHGSASAVGGSKMIADSIKMVGGSSMIATGAVNPLTIVKSYMYKIYSSTGVFLGTWNDVVSDFGYSQEINTAGASMDVTLARNSDSIIQNYGSLGDDSNVNIQTDDGNDIAAELTTSNAIGPGTTVDLNLNVKIYEFNSNDHQVDGHLVFTGYISQYVSQYGDNEQTVVSLFSYGADLDNWVLQDAATNTRIPYYSQDPSTILKNTLDKFNSAGGIITYSSDVTTRTNLITNPSFETNITGWVAMNSPTTCAASTDTAYSGTQSLKIVTTTAGNQQGVQTNTGASYITGITAGQTYTFSVWVLGPVGSTVTFTGNMWDVSNAQVNGNFSTITGSAVWQRMSITMTAAAGAVKATTSVFVTAGTVQTFYVDAFMLEQAPAATVYFDGSTALTSSYSYKWTGTANASTSIEYIPASIDQTGTIASYTFNLNTELEAIKQCLTLAPTDWYFYTDLATNYLHFHGRPTTPLHKFYLGKHILSLNLQKTMEGLVNDVYFTGGTPTYLTSDSFSDVTGTALTSHVGEVGGAWTKHTSSAAGTGFVITDANRVRPQDSGEQLIMSTTDAGTNDYVITVDYFVPASGPASGDVGIAARVQTGALTYYLGRLWNDGTVQLYKCIAGTYTSLATSAAITPTLAPGQTRHVTMTLAGNKISIGIDGTTYVDVVDGSIPLGSRYGVRSGTALANNTTGMHLDNYKVKPVNAIITPSIYKHYTDATSISTYRRGLDRKTDNRVSLLTSADIIVGSEINRAKNPRYQSTVTISNLVYDTSTIKLGQLVGFRNFGNFVDSVTMQIVRIDYTPDHVVLQLDTLFPSVPKRLEDIKRNLEQEQVADNPDAPTT